MKDYGVKVADVNKRNAGYARQQYIAQLKDLAEQRESRDAILQRWPSVDDLAEGLWQLLDTQQQVSSRVPDCIPELGDRPTKQMVANYGHALIHEVGELMDELSWSPWKDQKPVNRERTLDEFADVLAFLGVLTVYVQRATGATVQEMAEAYLKKTRVNVDRLAGKVDGYRQNAKR